MFTVTCRTTLIKRSKKGGILRRCFGKATWLSLVVQWLVVMVAILILLIYTNNSILNSTPQSAVVLTHIFELIQSQQDLIQGSIVSQDHTTTTPTAKSQDVKVTSSIPGSQERIPANRQDHKATTPIINRQDVKATSSILGSQERIPANRKDHNATTPIINRQDVKATSSILGSQKRIPANRQDHKATTPIIKRQEVKATSSIVSRHEMMREDTVASILDRKTTSPFESKQDGETKSVVTSTHDMKEASPIAFRKDLTPASQAVKKASLPSKRKNVQTSLEEYLLRVRSHGQERHTIIFLWDASGQLVKHTPITTHTGWIRKDLLSTAFSQTEPSEYGKVALLFNSDVMEKIQENILPPIPPVPFMLYTTPYKKVNISTFITIPTAYELNTLVERSVDLIKERMGNSFLLSAEEFFSRKSVIVWRGAVHNKYETSRIRLIEIGKNESNHDWVDASSGEIFETEYVPEYMIKQFKYHVDIGGVSGTSWGGLRWKMCSGGLIFKVDTWAKDRWHDLIEPWTHYIPVTVDLNNIREMYDWAEQNPMKAYHIALEGQKKCLESYKTQYSRNILASIIHDLPPSSKETVEQAKLFLK